MKTTYSYSHYFDYHQTEKCLINLANTYPHLMSVQSICKTHDELDVYAVSITDQSTGSFADKPALYIDGNHHAGEVMGAMAALHCIDYVLTNFETDDAIKSLLQNNTLYVIPKVSPDGSDVFLHEPISIRSTKRAYPSVKREDGLHPSDLDGDGVIRLMRVQSPYGVWKESSIDSRLFEKRQPDDTTGPFYFVFPEGEIENYDGLTVKLAPTYYGLDFNRNYPFGWFTESRQPGAGAYPLSNPENKAVADFIINHKNIATVATLHTSGGMIIYPPGVHPEKQANAFDMNLYKELGQIGTEETGYPTYNIFDAFLTDTENYSSGALDDWCYFTQGLLAYTVEFWDLLKKAGVEHVYPINRPKDLKTLGEYAKLKIDWINENADEIDRFKPWTTFNHPQLGVVEIGGTNFKFTEQNCPPAFLKEEIENNTRFMIRLAHTLPNVIIESQEVKPLAENLFEVSLVIGNLGYLPTYITKQACELKVDTPLTVTCHAKEVIGLSTQTIGHLDGIANHEAFYYYSGIRTHVAPNNRKKVTFIVAGSKNDELSFTVTSSKIKTLTTTITL